jgi:hypothetical protein
MAAKRSNAGVEQVVILDGVEDEGGVVPGKAPERRLKAVDEGPEERAREEAFDGVHLWNGEELHGFSIDRYGIFVSHRVAMGAPRMGVVLSDPDAFFPDALRILYLCSVEAGTLRKLAREPEALEAAVYAWAAEAVPMNRRYEAEGVAIQIFNGVYVNQHEPAAPSGGRTHGDDVGN